MTTSTGPIKNETTLKKLKDMSKKEAVTFLTKEHPELSNIAIAATLNCNATYVSQLKSKMRNGSTVSTAEKKATAKATSKATPKATRKPTRRRSTTKKATTKTKQVVAAKKNVKEMACNSTTIFDVRRSLRLMTETHGIDQLKAALADIEMHG